MADPVGGDAWRGALGGPEDGFLGRLDRWVADARIDAAALQRSRERWLGDVATQEATLSGVLMELAERGTAVALRTTGDRRHVGRLQVVGVDFVALRPASAAEVLVALRAVGLVRPADAVEVVGDRVAATDLRLVDLLTELAADRERVLLVTTAGDAVSGVLQSVGHDVAVVRTDGGEGRSSIYVSLGAIGEVRLG